MANNTIENENTKASIAKPISGKTPPRYKTLGIDTDIHLY